METQSFYEPLAGSGRGPQTEPEIEGLYVAQVTFDQTGPRGLEVLVAQAEGPAIPGGLPNPVTTATSQLAFRNHPCNNPPLTGTM